MRRNSVARGRTKAYGAAMLAIRPVISDGDYQQLRMVQAVVVPHERVPTVEEMRAGARPDQIRLLAERDGQVVGSAYAGCSNLTGGVTVAPQVLPAFRRQGVGTELLRALVAHASMLTPDFLVGHADDPGSRTFAERFGFIEVDRQVEQVRMIGDEPWPPAPTGFDVITVAEQPELWTAAFEQVALQAFQDMAVISPVTATIEEWQRDWIGDPAAMFVAAKGGEPIGVAGLIVDADDPSRAENALTAVRREWRGMGVASTLKRMTLAWAAEHGLCEVYTWTQKGNAGMRRLNEHLGYVTRLQSFTMRAELPLTV